MIKKRIKEVKKEQIMVKLEEWSRSEKILKSSLPSFLSKLSPGYHF
jgi:hypothetical protein